MRYRDQKGKWWQLLSWLSSRAVMRTGSIDADCRIYDEEHQLACISICRRITRSLLALEELSLLFAHLGSSHYIELLCRDCCDLFVSRTEAMSIRIGQISEAATGRGNTAS